MGRQDSNVVVHSSIALLQERFRQLQKVKEMREERELVRLLSLSNPKKHASFNTNCVLFDPSVARFLSHPEFMMMLPPTPTTMLTLPQTSLSLWPTSPSQGKKLGVSVDVPPLMNLWPTSDRSSSTCCDSVVSSLISKVDDDDRESDSDTDVDTSLHL